MLSETDPSPCVDCRQLLIRDANTGRPKNFVDGDGGFRGGDHICPKRIGSKYHKVSVDWDEYHKAQMVKHCVTCGLEFYTTAFNLCPNCYALECRNCRHKRPWKKAKEDEIFMTPITQGEATYIEAVIQEECPNCGSTDQADVISLIERVKGI